MASENLVNWFDKAMAEGEASGQRKILVQLAQARFGAGTAAELSDQLERVSSSEKLDTIGEWLINCANGEALLAKIRQA